MGDARREHCLLSNHKHQLQKEEKWDREREKRAWRLITSSVAFSVAFLLYFIYYSVLFMDPFIMKVCFRFMDVGNPSHLELPLHIFTQDLPCSFIVSFIVYSLLRHKIKKNKKTKNSQSVLNYCSVC